MSNQLSSRWVARRRMPWPLRLLIILMIVVGRLLAAITCAAVAVAALWLAHLAIAAFLLYGYQSIVWVLS